MLVDIRLAQLTDLIAILGIINNAIINTTSNYNYEIQTLEQQELWFLEKQKKKFPVYVAIFEREVIGFGTYGTFREKIGYQFTVEHTVYVNENYIGKGIGKLLLSTLIEKAKSANFHQMIGCIDAQNITSIRFHEKFGFIVAGTIKEVGYKFDRWLDLVIMQLKL